MVDLKSNLNGAHEYNHESRMRTDSFGTVPSTPSSSSDYMTGEADDSSDDKSAVPFSLKSVETILSLSKVQSKHLSSYLCVLNYTLHPRLHAKRILKRWYRNASKWYWKVQSARTKENGLSDA